MIAAVCLAYLGSVINCLQYIWKKTILEVKVLDQLRLIDGRLSTESYKPGVWSLKDEEVCQSGRV